MAKTMKQRALRLPDELWDGIRVAAENDYSTLNSWCARALHRAVKDQREDEALVGQRERSAA